MDSTWKIYEVFSPLLHLVSDSGSIHIMKITEEDVDDLSELINDKKVYTYLPTFLYEKNHGCAYSVIDGLYSTNPSTGAFTDSLILGIFHETYENHPIRRSLTLCGIIELYGFRDEIHKISIGYRLLSRWWGKGIASESLRMIIEYLKNETDIEIITASTMVQNVSSNRVLEKNGFTLVNHDVDEDWGYLEMTPADKWIC